MKKMQESLMKKNNSVFAVGVILLAVLCLTLVSCGRGGDKTHGSSDETIRSGFENDVRNFIYESDGKEITITGYSGMEASITIPSEIDGLPVTAVAENAFRGFLYLEKVVIPNSVKTIDYAFVACEDLEYVYIGKGVTSMNGAFRGCISLKTVAGGANAEYMDEAFLGCKSLTAGTVPSSAQSALSAFSGCTSLRSVSVNSGITCLDKTFENCTDLRTIAIPDSVIYLVSAFSGCTALTGIEGGENVSVYNAAFRDCVQLTEITLGKPVTELISAFTGCTSLKKIDNLPLSVEKYTASFSGCKALSSIVVPAIQDKDSLAAYSPSEDFSGCESAETVEIYADYVVREEFCKAFSGLLSLNRVTLPQETAQSLLRVSFSFADTLYEGNDKKVTSALKTCRNSQTVRVTDDYAVIGGINYSHIYGGDVNEVDADAEAGNVSVIGFSPFERKSYWCGYPTGGNRKTETVAVERTYSFYLRTTGKNTGTLPQTVMINGISCAVGE